MNAIRLVTALAVASSVVLVAAPAVAADDSRPNVDLTSVQQAVNRVAPQVTVSVRSPGVVELAGWADDRQDVQQAAAAARQVPGVRQAYSQSVRVWSTRSL